MLRSLKILVLTAIISITFISLSQAKLPAPSGYVNDFANILDVSSENYLEQVLSSFQKQTGNEVVVATVTSLDERSIEDYAEELYQAWGIGKKGEDSGALLLIAPNERKLRIEVGYGLEGIINDAMAGRIIREKIVPDFAQGDFNLGIVKGATTLVAVIAQGQGINFDLEKAASSAPIDFAQASEKKGPLHTVGAILVVIAMVFLFIRYPRLFLFLLLFSGRGGFGGGRGSFGGGFGGFGGGSSGGGGASGSW
ncbi:MAG: TPM domain-containing protein [Pseudomonadota bacterium]